MNALKLLGQILGQILGMFWDWVKRADDSSGGALKLLGMFLVSATIMGFITCGHGIGTRGKFLAGFGSVMIFYVLFMIGAAPFVIWGWVKKVDKRISTAEREIRCLNRKITDLRTAALDETE